MTPTEPGRGAVASAAMTSGPAQVRIPSSAMDVSGPVAGNTMLASYIELVGQMAYFWGLPIVNSHNRRVAFSAALAPGRLGGILPVAPVGYKGMLTDCIKPEQTFVVCPNRDVA